MTPGRKREAFRIILEKSLNVAKGDDLLVVFDESFDGYLRAAEQTADGLSLQAACTRVPLAHQRRSVEIVKTCPNANITLPPALEGAILRSRNILNVLSPGKGTLLFRLAVIQAKTDDSRLAHIPGINDEVLDVMLRTPMHLVEERCEALAWALGEAATGLVYTTDCSGQRHELHVNLGKWDNEPFVSAGIIPRGSWGNIPPGEVFCCPELESVNGSICINGSIPGHVLKASDEIILTFSKGRMTWRCRPSSRAAAFFRNAERQAEEDGDENWNCFAELGFGLNPAITRLSGNPVFDEKATETLHIAFGDNSGFGHNVFAKTHQDLVVRKPTLLLDGTPVIQEGEVFLEAIEMRRQNILPTEQVLSPSCLVALRENHCAVHNSALRRRLFAGNRIGYVNISPQRYAKVLADLHKALGTYGRVRVATLDRDYPHFEGVNTSELLQIMLHYRMLDAQVG